MDEILSKEDFTKVFGKVEDIKIRLWHMHSLADLLVVKYQEMIDADEIGKRDEFSTPILSIAEMLTEKAESSLRNIEEIEEVSMRISSATI